MSDKITQFAAQCGAKFMPSGVGFDDASWAQFTKIVGLLLPAGENERLRHADCGSIELFYAKSPTAATYEYLASFCRFQASCMEATPPESALSLEEHADRITPDNRHALLLEDGVPEGPK